jgi:predicted RNase H-like HicB family nuclease
MTFRYPAVFKKNDDGRYTTYFPDLEMCTAKGDTLDDCINDAIAECRDWIQTELLETLDMPPVSDYEDIPLSENEHIRTIGVIVRLYEGWDE